MPKGMAFFREILFLPKKLWDYLFSTLELLLNALQLTLINLQTWALQKFPLILTLWRVLTFVIFIQVAFTYTAKNGSNINFEEINSLTALWHNFLIFLKGINFLYLASIDALITNPGPFITLLGAFTVAFEGEWLLKFILIDKEKR